MPFLNPAYRICTNGSITFVTERFTLFCIETVELRGGLGGEAASLLVVITTCLLPNDVLLPTVFAEQIYCSPYTVLAR